MIDELLVGKVIERAKIGVNSWEFGGVYDHKLLWRANLYIDEEVDDWNDANRWDSPDNIWNYTGNGGQCAISSWTRYNYPANTIVNDAVAYSHACYDSPADFNADLIDQRNAVRGWYSSNNSFWSIDSNNDGQPDNINPHPEWGVIDGPHEWDSTLAPDNIWGMTENNNLISYRFGTPTGNAVGTYNAISYNVNNIPRTYYPYTPNFTSKKKNETPSGYHSIHTSYSSGIDCVTLIQRSASYTGNRYSDLTDIPESRQTWGQNAVSLEHVGSVEAACWIMKYSERHLLIPGDLVIIYGENDDGSEWGHSTIVNKLVYTNGRNIIEQNVRLIESSGSNMKVRNDRTWKTYDDFNSVTRILIGRIKH